MRQRRTAVYRCQAPRYNRRIMVSVTLLSDRAVFEAEGLDQLWALRSRLEIPLTHITDAECDPDLVGRWWHGWKLPGADVPGLFAAERPSTTGAGVLGRPRPGQDHHRGAGS